MLFHLGQNKTCPYESFFALVAQFESLQVHLDCENIR